MIVLKIFFVLLGIALYIGLMFLVSMIGAGLAKESGLSDEEILQAMSQGSPDDPMNW